MISDEINKLRMISDEINKLQMQVEHIQCASVLHQLEMLAMIFVLGNWVVEEARSRVKSHWHKRRLEQTKRQVYKFRTNATCLLLVWYRLKKITKNGKFDRLEWRSGENVVRRQIGDNRTVLQGCIQQFEIRGRLRSRNWRNDCRVWIQRRIDFWSFRHGRYDAVVLNRTINSHEETGELDHRTDTRNGQQRSLRRPW